MNREAPPAGPEDFYIFMAIAKQVGKDRRGNPIFKRDPDGTATGPASATIVGWGLSTGLEGKAPF